MYNPDMPVFFEKEKEVETKVIMYFMRHGKRQKGATDEEDTNPDLRLTPEGRMQSTNKGEKVNPQANIALGWGSSRTRAQESSYRTMLANEDINPEDSFEVIESKISQELKYGKKMKVDDRLCFAEHGIVGDELVKAYGEGKYFSYMANDSDHRAIEEGDKLTNTYTRTASNVAEIILHHLKIGENFNRIATKKSDYEKFGNQLERYMGTHMGISESFVAKAIEKIQGKEKRDEFLTAAGGGFKETEGIKIEIINKGKTQNIFMTYGIDGVEEKVELNREILEDIIRDREEFEKKVEKGKEK